MSIYCQEKRKKILIFKYNHNVYNSYTTKYRQIKSLVTRSRKNAIQLIYQVYLKEKRFTSNLFSGISFGVYLINSIHS